MTRKILITGACQAPGFAAALSLFLPDDEIRLIPYHELTSGQGRESFADSARDASLWLSHFPYEFLGLNEAAGLGPSQHIKLPEFHFRAFHPDNVHALKTGTTTSETLRGPYNLPYCSAIVFWCWKNGVPIARVERCFTAACFERLGYLDAWTRETSRARSIFAACGLDFDPLYLAVRRRGNFMWTHNHPKTVVLVELARLFALRLGAGERVKSDPVEDILDESLSAIIWPVYPPIAERNSISGAYRWKMGAHYIHALGDFIRMSYAAYADQNPDDYECSFYDTALFDQVLGSATGIDR